VWGNYIILWVLLPEARMVSCQFLPTAFEDFACRFDLSKGLTNTQKYGKILTSNYSI
jgi:hypothetical protein